MTPQPRRLALLSEIHRDHLLLSDFYLVRELQEWRADGTEAAFEGWQNDCPMD